MNFNLREKLEQARAEDRARVGLPQDPASPWLVNPTIPGGGSAVAARARTATGSTTALPAWTGEATTAARLVELSRSDPAVADRSPSGDVADGDRCGVCGGTIRTDLVDLVGGVTHLSCRDCGLRHHVTCPV